MKKLIAGMVSLVILLTFISPALAVKPTTSATNVPWNSIDENSSAAALNSKLIVNQPNGNTEVTLTGVMNGLEPNTTYSTAIKYVEGPRWILRNQVYSIVITMNTWDMFLTLHQNGYLITGLFQPIGDWESDIYGSLYGNHLEFNIDNSNYPLHFSANINSLGYVEDGKWSGNFYGSNGGTWSYNNEPIADLVPGLLTDIIYPFAFTTDSLGNGSWHVNLKDADFSEIGNFTLISTISDANEDILKSNSFDVSVGIK